MVVVEHPHLEVVGSRLPKITIFPLVNLKTELPKSPCRAQFRALVELSFKLPECLQYIYSQARVKLEQHVLILGQVQV